MSQTYFVLTPLNIWFYFWNLLGGVWGRLTLFPGPSCYKDFQVPGNCFLSSSRFQKARCDSSEILGVERSSQNKTGCSRVSSLRYELCIYQCSIYLYSSLRTVLNHSFGTLQWDEGLNQAEPSPGMRSCLHYSHPEHGLGHGPHEQQPRELLLCIRPQAVPDSLQSQHSEELRRLHTLPCWFITYPLALPTTSFFSSQCCPCLYNPRSSTALLSPFVRNLMSPFCLAEESYKSDQLLYGPST